MRVVRAAKTKPMSLLAIDNLQQLSELLPESLANDQCVLVKAISASAIEVAHPSSADWSEENKRIVEFHLKRDLVWTPYPTEEIEQAIRIAYGSIRPVGNCSWRFDYECPARWESLEKTNDASIRNCLKCNKQVHLCFSQSQVIEHAKSGRCICLVNCVSGETIGDVRILDESELSQLSRESLWPTCPKCENPTQTKYGKQCFACGYRWY